MLFEVSHLEAPAAPLPHTSVPITPELPLSADSRAAALKAVGVKVYDNRFVAEVRVVLF